MDKRPLLVVNGLTQHFKISSKYTVKAVNNVSFHINYGETYGLVGESGSGKSTIGRSLIRLYNPTAGSVIFEDVNVSGKLLPETKKHIQSRMQMIFQDPMACLNPRKKVMDIVAQGIDIGRLYKTKEEREQKVYDIMDKIGLSREHAGRYPHQFSGGQRQRIGIARALIMNPSLIIADEPISALDVSIQAQVVNLMKDLQSDFGLAFLFIAHDLSMVKYISDRIGVLHLGYLVEEGLTEEIFSNPIHPYTKSLLSAIPVANPRFEKNRISESYDYKISGIDYSKGLRTNITDTHSVLATKEEFEMWKAVE